jgi:hypothetical protein
MEPDATFRTSVRQRHAEAFDIASRVATTLGEACVLRAVTTDDETAIALDMLVQQAWQAHASVCILTERTYVHSAMILTRHLLELSVQALYIVGAAPPETPRDRARRFLAKLWTGIPEDARSSLLSQECIDAWARRADEWTRELPSNPKARWPNFREMFEANGMGAAYVEDYRYLSGDAHGSAWLALGNYMRSDNTDFVHEPLWIPLLHASRYYIATALCWNTRFALIEGSTLSELIDAVSAARGRYGQRADVQMANE